MPIYFIQSKQITGRQIQITGKLLHHLRDALRFQRDEPFDVVDEHRRRYRVAVEDITPDHLVAHILTIEEPSTLPSFQLFLAQALLKRPKMDWVVQKATELGVTKLLPLVTERTVVRPSLDRSLHQRDRWWKIAREAAQQCGRSEIPEVKALADFSDLCGHPPEADLKLILWEQEREHSLRSWLASNRPIRSFLLLVGSEGGFSLKEIDLARRSGFGVASLGRRILRAETASLTALAILQYELGDMR